MFEPENKKRKYSKSINTYIYPIYIITNDVLVENHKYPILN